MRYLREIVINRPMFFLCGPALSKSKDASFKDRRIVLSNYISKFETQFLKPFPIIVDELFRDEDEIKNNGLDLRLLEEIVSNISYQTYIFLDTMSTSYELGLFTNTKQHNNVKLLLDSEYSHRQNCYVGEYIVKSQNTNKIEYIASYNNRGHIFFKDNIVPKCICDEIENDLKDLENINAKIKFIRGLSEKEEVGKMHYDVKSNKTIDIQINMLTLFYYMRYSLDKKTDNSEIDCVDIIKKEVVKSFIALCDDNDLIRKIIFENWNIKLFSYYYEMEKIIKHMSYIMNVMQTKVVSHNVGTVKIPFDKKSFRDGYFQYDFSDAYSLFGLTKHDKRIIEEYNENYKEFIDSFILPMKSKKRKIQTYKNTKKGKDLKKLHTKINEILKSILPSSKNSYAYKKNKNIKQCVLNHISSTYFYKTDIKDYFHSMSKNNFILLLKEVILNKIEEFSFKYNIYFYRHLNMKFYREIFSVVLINYKFPIGFVTSPVISDFYLYKFDEKLTKLNCIYTRYADDILLSSSACPIDGKTKKYVSSILESYGLKVNTKKDKNYFLKNKGDTIKFLGILICKGDNGNFLKISNKYIVETSKLIQLYVKTKKVNLKEKCIGMCNYIKNIDENSYIKLEKIYKIKCNSCIPREILIERCKIGVLM